MRSQRRLYRNQGSNPIIPSGLLSYHNFNDNLLDSVGDNHGTGTPVYTDGLNGQRVVDIGTDGGDAVGLPNRTLAGRSNVSISCMFKLKSNVETQFYGSWYGPNTCIQLKYSSNALHCWIGGATTEYLNFGAYTFNTNWHHLVFTKTPTEAKIYIDGVQFGTIKASTNTFRSGTQPETWGFAGNSVSNLFLDGGAIWDKPLTQSEITEIYNTQNAGNELI